MTVGRDLSRQKAELFTQYGEQDDGRSRFISTTQAQYHATDRNKNKTRSARLIAESRLRNLLNASCKVE
ncbi:hypothetical protein L3V43_02695 [Pseudoalteromonas sp. L23]|uniref:hypothetical protein n=1 Tax=unclassified Pseudoalteromonas TaxID=194690 RepID=UPI001F440FCB|nr:MULTISPECIES: hypothetical protein [unclassified Pseudoalteromonas]MCF2825117.1 hypothetical protein [Pseudoalteromonas sp. OF5H-5]MCF2832234.1 hypothetical protein [Pseudoalteromonas sp. DL2-H6]MCF2925643.1 hypothetical protein [Pseudoalteromonas sp. DL2-H1]MCF7512221.1 hypothetical protein [Pseudoalteromonas sp. L7]MCF7524565.1 hypothetical protein [Pseudoalteromonas sp. L23]